MEKLREFTPVISVTTLLFKIIPPLQAANLDENF